MSLLHVNGILWLVLAIVWTTEGWPNFLIKLMVGTWGAYLLARSLV